MFVLGQCVINYWFISQYKPVIYDALTHFYCGRHCGLMVSALDSGASGPGLSPGRGHCVVFLVKTLYSHTASLHPGIKMGSSELDAGGNPAMD